MLKKIVLISSIILFGLAIIAGIYFLLFGTKTTSPLPVPEQITMELPTLTAENLLFASQFPYIGASIGPDGRKIRYFDQNVKSFFEVEFSGLNPVKLLDADLEDVSDIIWSPDKSKAIAVLDEKGVKRYRFVDLTTGETIIYPREWKSPVFSPLSDKIAYNFLDAEKNVNRIEIADVSGKNSREVSKIRIQDAVIWWPQNDKLAFSSRSSIFNDSGVFLFDIAKNELQKIIPESNGLEILWSSSGNKIIFSSADKTGENLKLKLADVDKKEIKDLGISTFASKCFWSADNRTIFCAVPFEWPNIRLTLPDDYWQKKFFTFDHAVKIDINANQKEVVFSAENNPPDIQNIFLEPKEEYLFFTNKKDGLFYAIKL